MANATVIRLCDAVVERIREILAESSLNYPADVVRRVYLPDAITPKDLPELRIDVYPLRYQQETAGGDRGTDALTYAIGMDVWARYAGSEPEVSTEWIDDRVTLCETLFSVLGDPRRDEDGLPLFSGEFEDVWADTNEVAYVYDPDRLRDHRVFLSSIEIGYRRDE
jgi:hypothetical protein